MTTQQVLHRAHDSVVTGLEVPTPPLLSITRTRVPAFAVSSGSQNPDEGGATRRRRRSPQHVLHDAPAHQRVFTPTFVARRPAAWPPRSRRRRPACAGARTRKRRSDPQRQLPATHAHACVAGRSRPTTVNRHLPPIGTGRRAPNGSRRLGSCARAGP